MPGRPAKVPAALALSALALVVLSGVCGGRDRALALAALEAVAKSGKTSQIAAAEAFTAKLADTGAAAEAQVLLAGMYERARPADAAEKLGRMARALAAGRHPAQAAIVARHEARLAWSQSRYPDALAAFDLSIQQAELAGDAPLRARGLLGVFTLLYEMGDLRGAEAALKLATRDPRALDDELRTTVAFDRGLLADAEGQGALAIATFKEVLRSPTVKPFSELAWLTSLNLFTLALDSGAVPLAQEASATVERVFAGGPFKTRSNSRIARGLGEARLALLREQPAAALAQLDALAAENPSAQWAWKIALERGRALQALGRLEQAEAAFESSAEVVEHLRSDQYDDFKSWVVAQRRAPFEALFSLHVARGDGLRALQVHERVQGRTFIEAFAANTTGAGSANATSRVTWLRKLYPALHASPVLAAPPPTVDELRARLRELATRNERALSYFETTRALYVIDVAGGSVHINAAGAPLATIRALVARLQAAPDDATTARALGDLLLPTATTRTAPPPRLYITPSATLARLPFAALRRGDRALITDFTLAQVPSLAALQALRPMGKTPPTREAAVILADAAADLPEAAAEGRAVAQHLAGSAVQLYAGPAATRARLDQAQDARLLHLAVHSGVGATGPFLALADGPLLAGELLDRRIRAQLVVLASCASAATPDPGLWGSLVASFLASGSPAVVGSLWSTRDQISRAFVERFYGEGGLTDPAAALARTQRAWIAEGRPTADWAAFAFYGPGAS